MKGVRRLSVKSQTEGYDLLVLVTDPIADCVLGLLVKHLFYCLLRDSTHNSSRDKCLPYRLIGRVIPASEGIKVWTC